MRKNLIVYVAVFVFGVVAGLGVGAMIGKNNENARLVQSNNELQTRLDTANENFMILMREYNKLFSSRASVLGNAPIMVAPSSETETVIVPQVEATQAPTEVAPAPPAASTPAVADSALPSGGGKPVANFQAESINGTGPLEGPPPQPFQFTDQSTGNVTSWLWDFGDGTTSNEQDPMHTIEKCPGESELCTVSLTVCGPDGCDTMTKVDYLWVSESCTGC